MPAAPPNYYAELRAEIGRILHAINNSHGVTASNARYLNDCSLRGMTTEQVGAIRDANTSAEKTSTLLRELAVILG